MRPGRGFACGKRHVSLTPIELIRRAWGGALQFTTAAPRTHPRVLDEALVAAHRISVKEFEVPITLFNAPDGRLRMTARAERALLTPSGLIHVVTRLERDGLVRRSVDAADRRSFLAPLTHPGHRRLLESRPTHNEVIRAHLTRRLTASQMATLGALWEAVQTGEMPPPPNREPGSLSSPN
jgi:DNA-binding MarR family transcriptional regulator